MGVVIGSVTEEVPGLAIRSFLDPEGLRLSEEDREPRSTEAWIHSIVLHTTKGIPGGSDQRRQQILDGSGPHKNHIAAVAQAWASDHICASAHFLIDQDGTIACVADLLTETTYHAGQRAVNHHSIGIEMYQGEEAELYAFQLEQTVRLVDFLTRRFGIQRQFHAPYRNQAVQRIKEGGSSVVAVYGHREASDDRGAGDPGDAIFSALLAAGYECFDFDKEEDRAVWKVRQTDLNQKLGLSLTVDGVPGPETVVALRTAGYPHGMWIPRPGD